jgi:hypothetical protein
MEETMKHYILVAVAALLLGNLSGCKEGTSDGTGTDVVTEDGKVTLGDTRVGEDLFPEDAQIPGEDVPPKEDLKPGEDAKPGEDVEPLEDVVPGEDLVPGEDIVPGDCTGSCEGRECGDDGCGASCGTCEAEETCSPNGVCVPAGSLSCVGYCGSGPDADGDETPDCYCDDECFEWGDCCEDVCTACPDLTGCCTPVCEGKECGDDGCGATCGECEAGLACTADGLCEPAGPLSCDGYCQSGPDIDNDGLEDCFCDEVCFDSGDCCEDVCTACPELAGCCASKCEGKECGDDGCGATCGECLEGFTCVEGLCTCPKQCAGKQCGDDGCGGTCGACAAGVTCVEGLCVPAAGALVVTEFMKDPDKVVDEKGEWIELYNASANPIDINGWTVKDGNKDAFTIQAAAPLVIAAGKFGVVARVAEPEANGGVAGVLYAWGTKMSLANNDDEIILMAGTAVIDQVAYDEVEFPDPTGASVSLSDGNYDAVKNDAGASWCAGKAAYGLGDLGTPGAANPLCGLPAGADCYMTEEDCAPGTECWYNATWTSLVCYQDNAVGAGCGDGLGGCAEGSACAWTDATKTVSKCYADLAAGAACGEYGTGSCPEGTTCNYTDANQTAAKCYPDVAVGAPCVLPGFGYCQGELTCNYTDATKSKTQCYPNVGKGQPCDLPGYGSCQEGLTCNWTSAAKTTTACYADVGKGVACGTVGLGDCQEGLFCNWTDAAMTAAKCYANGSLGDKCSAPGTGMCNDWLLCVQDEADPEAGVCVQLLFLGDECGAGLGGCLAGMSCIYDDLLAVKAHCYKDQKAGADCGYGIGLCEEGAYCAGDPEAGTGVCTWDECWVNGWYDDGICHKGCPEPDPDCE